MKKYKINYKYYLVGGKDLDVLMYKYLSSLKTDTENLYIPLISMDFINNYPDGFYSELKNFWIKHKKLQNSRESQIELENSFIEETKTIYKSILESYGFELDYLTKQRYIISFKAKIRNLLSTTEYNIKNILGKENKNKLEYRSQIKLSERFFDSPEYVKYKTIYELLKNKNYNEWLNKILELNNETYHSIYFEKKNDNLIKNKLKINDTGFTNLRKLDASIRFINTKIEKVVIYQKMIKQHLKDYTIIIQKTNEGEFELENNNYLTIGENRYYNYFDEEQFKKILKMKNLYDVTPLDLNISDFETSCLDGLFLDGVINFKYVPDLKIFKKKNNIEGITFNEIKAIIETDELSKHIFEKKKEDYFNIADYGNNHIMININDDAITLNTSNGRNEIIANDIPYEKIYCIPDTLLKKNRLYNKMLESIKDITECIVNKYVYHDELIYLEKPHKIDNKVVNYVDLKEEKNVISGINYESKHLFPIYSNIIEKLNVNLLELQKKVPNLRSINKHDNDNNYRILNGYEYGKKEESENPIGELDLLILNDNNEIVAVAEIKNYLDGANLGYKQLQKFYDHIKEINTKKKNGSTQINNSKRQKNIILKKKIGLSEPKIVSCKIYPDLYKKIINDIPIEKNKYFYLVLGNSNYTGISNSCEIYKFISSLIKANKITYIDKNDFLKTFQNVLDDISNIVDRSSLNTKAVFIEKFNRLDKNENKLVVSPLFKDESIDFKVIKEEVKKTNNNIFDHYTYEILEKYKQNKSNLIIIED